MGFPSLGRGSDSHHSLQRQSKVTNKFAFATLSLNLLFLIPHKNFFLWGPQNVKPKFRFLDQKASNKEGKNYENFNRNKKSRKD